MKDWAAYSQTKAKANELNQKGGTPNIFEYGLIKVIDNGLLVTIIGLSVLFILIGTILFIYDKTINTWFFDLAKLSFGVVLGMLAERKKK